ncbi:MAG TPA: hypothetical protein VMT64_07540 [Candidatus Binataceae bacterium]|nr:hypothetical protein [Candidatus Binataceae bacterium]
MYETFGAADPCLLPHREIRSLAAQFEDIASRSYRRQLRNHFSDREIRGLVAAMEMTVPALNRSAFGNTDTHALRTLAQPLGVEVKAVPFGDEREDLRGFYIPSRNSRIRPAMWLNTTHHRIVVASTFWHELGHHVVDRLGEKAEALTLMYRDEYDAHMGDASELSADIMLVLAIYPKPNALKLFGRFLKADRVPDAYDLARCALRYLPSVAGFEFAREFPATGDLHHLAGMIHYAKLRWALLAEYRI